MHPQSFYFYQKDNKKLHFLESSLACLFILVLTQNISLHLFPQNDRGQNFCHGFNYKRVEIRRQRGY